LKKQQLLAATTASHCLIFPVFPTVFSLQPIYLSHYFFLILAWGGKGKGNRKKLPSGIRASIEIQKGLPPSGGNSTGQAKLKGGSSKFNALSKEEMKGETGLECAELTRSNFEL